MKLTLVKKFLILFFVGYFVTLMVIITNLIIGLNLENNAVAINLSGQGRYRTYELYFLTNQYMLDKKSNDAYEAKLMTKMNNLEQILVSLRFGNEKLRINQVSDSNIINSLDKIIVKFKKDIKPSIKLAINSKGRQEYSSEMNKTGKKIEKFVSEVNKVVYAYQNLSIRQVQFLKLAQIFFILVTVLAAGFIALLLMKWVRNPIEEVINGMRQVEGGNFSHKLVSNRSDEIGVLASSYNHMALELDKKTKKLEKLTGELKILSITDGLTGLYNHRHFYDIIDKELERAKRYDRFFSVVFIDIDLFKNFNDTYGHKAGDEVLRNVSSKILDQLRATDYAFRYGGEEFALIITETNKNDALTVAEKLRKSIEKSEIRVDSQTVSKVTISLGIASFPEDASSIDALVKASDDALYEAKEGGRNCTALYGVPVSKFENDAKRKNLHI